MKKLYFRLVIFTQMLMWLGVFLINNGSYYLQRGAEMLEDFILFPDLHTHIFPWNETYLALPAYFIVSLIWAAVFTLVGALVYKLLKKRLPQQSWRTLSFCQKAVLAEMAYIVIIYVFILLRKSAIDNISCYLNQLLLLNVITNGIIVSLITALLWQLGQWIGKKIRIAGIALTAIAPLVLLGYLAFFFYNVNNEILECIEADNQRYYNSSSLYSGAESDIVEDDYDEYPDEPEDIGEWEGPTESEAFINDCFRFIFFERKYQQFDLIYLEEPTFITWLTGNDNIANGAPDPRWVFANNVALYINRDNNRLLQFYYRFCDIIYEHIPWKKYNDIGGRGQVKLLLRTYNDCSMDYTLMHDLMLEMHDFMVNHNLNSGDDLYSALTQILRAHNISRYKIEEEVWDKSVITWAYSFWARRYNEGNHNAANQILNNIDNHYNYIENQLDINTNHASSNESN